MIVFFLTRHDFSWDIIFIYLLINLGDCSFLWLFATFFVLIGHHSLTRVYE